MSLAAQAATTLVALIAAVATVSLWRGANRHAGSVRRAYRLFALTAALWGAGAIGQQELATATAGATFPFTVADLPGLLALPVLVAGLASLGSRRETARHPLAQRHRARIGTAMARGADGYVVASALFIIGWITVLSAGVRALGRRPGHVRRRTHPSPRRPARARRRAPSRGGGRAARRRAGRRPARGDRQRHARGRGEDHQRAPGRGCAAAADRRVLRARLRALDRRLLAARAPGRRAVLPGRGTRHDRAGRGQRRGGRAGADRLGPRGQPGRRAGPDPGHRAPWCSP